MNIKVTDKLLSIPPYISTYWSRIAGLHVKSGVLAIVLVDGETLHIPNLNSEILNLIFQYHAVYLEKEHAPLVRSDLSTIKSIIDQEEPSIRLAFGSSLDGLGNMMQHNPHQANAPDLPPEILEKIGAVAKIITPSEGLLLPKAEANCNCFYCQIANALNHEIPPTVLLEPEITNEDLNFQPWSITQIGDKLFSVVNCLDEQEKYNVYLGQPIGCTCGKQGCEHILAVLKS